jgi:hypothetical protein
MLAIVGLIAGPFVASSPIPNAEQMAEPRDPRLVRLEHYFSEKQCPVKPLAKVFMDASDRHNLDWRLLPSIAFIESGGGKEYKNNNIFGWKNGVHRFRSVRHGIETVAERLANSHYYKGKKLDDVLYTYNPIQGYRERVKFVMEDLGPAEVAHAAKRRDPRRNPSLALARYTGGAPVYSRSLTSAVN